ncbi:hypothetical protein ACQEVM_18125 [Streptomyces sp. CA-243310]|uniref:hypothetical protein n=1 Tax=Streptomyces sp. CA-243310 TaxID=3240056 RepID=UPI003D942A46
MWECADGHSVTEVSRRLRIAPDTVRSRRRRFGFLTQVVPVIWEGWTRHRPRWHQ